MYADDRTRIRHMLDASLQAEDFVRGQSRGDLNENPMLLHALVRVIEIIGEAASRVSEEYKSRHPEIPWKRIIGMRNRLIHGYFTIDLDVVWDTATTEIPDLIAALRELETGQDG